MSVIAISGRIAAGKSTVARILAANWGWDILVRPQSGKGRSQVALLTERMRSGGADQHVVIDSLWSLAEWKALDQACPGGWVSIHVEAPREVRMLRRLGWSERDAEFYALDERGGDALDRLKPFATWSIFNGRSERELEEQVSLVIAALLPPAIDRTSPSHDLNGRKKGEDIMPISCPDAMPR